MNESSEYESESDFRPAETDQLDEKVKELCSKYDELIELAHGQRETLNGKLLSHNLQNDLKEMDHWIHTKLDLLERYSYLCPYKSTGINLVILGHIRVK